MSVPEIIEDLARRVAAQPRAVLSSPDVRIHLNAADFRIVQDWMDQNASWLAMFRGIAVLLRDVPDGGVIVGEEARHGITHSQAPFQHEEPKK